MYPASTWLAEIIFALGRFDEAREFLTDRRAIAAHVSEITRISSTGRTRRIRRGRALNNFREMKAEGFEETLAFLCRQQIVFQVSLTEVFIRDAFTLVFREKPERCIPYYSGPEREGGIGLKRIFAAVSLEAVVQEIIMAAAGRAADGPAAKLIERLEKLSGAKAHPNLKKSYEGLVALRYSLVHEKPRQHVNVKTVHRGYQVSEDILRFCEDALVALGTPVELMPEL